jgi:hypothetical protein
MIAIGERPVCVCDTECFPNYWLIGFRQVDGPRVVSFERTPTQRLNIPALLTIFRKYTVVTFNGTNYDMPMIALALMGAKNTLLKRANDEIILGGLKWWEFEERYGARMPEFTDHIDVMEVSPGSPNKPSLKLYAGRLHSWRMQDLPYSPDEYLTDEQIAFVRSYHGNDLEVTRDLYLELKPQIDLRTQMSQRYGVDVRSKSDAQVAEAVIKAEIQRRTGERVYRPDVTPGTFFYAPPPYIRFRSPELRALLETIRQAPFAIDRGGKLYVPPVMEKGVIVTLGEAQYKVGYGGLHSREKRVSYLSDDEYVLVDRDVTSYYPSIILGSGLYPKHIGPIFLEIYRSLYMERIAAKRAGDKDKAETLKIVLNGIFGKFGSPFSALYSPDLMLQTTLGGQLAVLMLVEIVEAHGFHVVSANTDGFVTRVARARRAEFDRLIAEWELNTVFMMDEVEYRALYSRDVNNYVAFTNEGKVKGKGVFTPAGRGLPGAAGLKKTPDREVVIDAVIEHLKHGTPVERTIQDCTDLRRFISVRRVKGGAEKDGRYLGKAIRWYWAVGEPGVITTAGSGNTVPKTEGAAPCMQLPETLPEDIDYAWYVREAYATLEELGMHVVDPALRGRHGKVYARLPDQSTWHVVDLPGGVARCGRRPASLREPWIEVRSVPAGQRLCKTCRESNDGLAF